MVTTSDSVCLIDPPSPPSSLRVTGSVDSDNSSTVIAVWTPPQSSAGILNYTVSVSPSPLSSDSVFSVTVPQLNLTVEYNQQYTVSVTATNCIGTTDTPAILNFTLG